MFTGIVSDIGTILRLEDRGDLRARIRCGYPAGGHRARRLDRLRRGVPDRGRPRRRTARAPGSTSTSRPRRWRAPTSARPAGGWAAGTRINLERALRLGDELGGHIVSGHVDGLAEVVSVEDEGDSVRVVFEVPERLARFVAPKGSVALNGTSLTVNEVEGRRFGVNIIPHTRTHTTWGEVRPGDLVNIEIDTLARYVARLAEYAAG